MFLLEEVREKDNGQRWNPTFQMLAVDTRHLTEDKTIKAAKAPQNRQLNRYRDVLPYDDTRVILKTGDHDYINGNYVEVPEIKRKYILAQGPLQHTCEDFWRMVWENESSGIVMLCRIVEKQMVKCHPYWPMGEDEVLEFDSFQVKNLQSAMEKDYIIRDLLLTNVETGESRTIKQFHFMTWPDFGVPENASSFLSFLYVLRANNVFGNERPPVIHCSAGIGRSGTIVLVDAALKMCEDNKSPNNLDIRDLLLNLRKYRCGLVQTAQQYRFAYVAILNGLSKLFPQVFQNAIEQEDDDEDEVEDDGEADDEEDETEPPSLPEKSSKSSIVPPIKPPRSALGPTEAEKDVEKFKQLNELSDGSEDDEEEIIDLSDPLLDADENEDATPASDVEVSTDDGNATDEDNGSDEEFTALIRNDVVKKDENIFPASKQDAEDVINDADVIGAKARESELRHRQRVEKREATKDLINNIKRKMKDSEKPNTFQDNTLWYVGVAIVVTSCVAIVYKWMS